MDAETIIRRLQDWSLKAGTLRTERPWCLLGLTEISDQAIAELLDRTDLEELHEERFRERDPLLKRQHSYLQVQLSILYGLQKAMTLRHRGRLQFYRDDSAQKCFHARRTVDEGLKRLLAAQEQDEERGRPVSPET
jgi:hypothetical protein